jgi:hypothetical protein
MSSSLSLRKRRKAMHRKMHGNPWDSSTSSTISMSPRFASTKNPKSNSTIKKIHIYKKPKKSSFKTRKTSSRVSFRSPITRSRSKSKSKSRGSTSTSHGVWKSVSSKNASSK